MSVYNFFYNSLIIVAFILSLVAVLKGHKRFGFLCILLFLTSGIELIVLQLIKMKLSFTWLYHSFNLVEYPLLALFLSTLIANKTVKKAVVISIPVYIICCFCISWFFYHFQDFPGLNIDIEGILLSIICTHILFNLEVINNQSIIKNPYFWICSGILVYFGTTFFYNGVYTQIVTLNSGEALELFGLINQPLNILLYTSMIIGLLCLQTKNNTTP